MKNKDLLDALSCTVLCPGNLDKEIKGCYIGDLLSWVMGRAQEGDIWITIMNHVNVLAVASLADVSCVLLAEGVTMEEPVLQKAQEQNITVLQSSKTAYQLAACIAQLL
mgnify:FL=1